MPKGKPRSGCRAELYTMPPGVGIGVARLMSEGYKQGKSMKTRLEEMYPTLVMNPPPNYGRQRLANVVCRDKNLIPTKLMEKKNAVVADANRKRLDDANTAAAKDGWERFKTAKLAKFKADPKYDSVPQHEKVRLAGNNRLESPPNPKASRITAKELDKKRKWSKMSKAKYDAGKRAVKQAKKAKKSKEHAVKDDVDAF
ncbi:uncharacterized protein JCM10292_000649 [Rhodotorula paludigena]|uniref:uncharacterized protein n=1 Tax=Rhodotorula paludigena TaxID=86838 RepID=UPI003178DC92